MHDNHCDNLHQAKLASQGTSLNPKTQKYYLSKDMNFLNKLYVEWDEVDKPVLVPISFDGSDDDDIEMITKVII